MTRQARPTLSIGQRAVIALLVLTALAVGPTLTARANPEEVGSGPGSTAEPITLTLHRAELADVLRAFAKMTNLTVAISPAVTIGSLSTPITIDANSQPWDQVLDEIIRLSGLAWTLEGNLLWVHLPGETPGTEQEFDGEPITLTLEDAKLEKVLQTFSALTGYTFDLASGVSASVTIRVTDMPWDQALDLILRVNGLTATISGTRVLISRAPAVGAVLLPDKPAVQSHSITPTGEVYRFVKDGAITEPRAVYRPNPVYPAAAKQAKTTGQVIVETTISAAGDVADIEVIKPQPDGLTEAAVEAIRQWHFEPALLDGVPVAVKYVLNVNFSLE